MKLKSLPPPLEIKTHVALERLLCLTLNPNWMYTHIPSGEYRDKVTAARLKVMGLKPGWPDFIFVGPAIFFLELKRKGGKPSEAQKEVAAGLKARGCHYHLSDTLDDAIATLNEVGIIRARAS